MESDGVLRQRRGPVHAALVEADQPDRRGEQVPLQGHEVVAALAGPAVQEQQWRRARVTPDVGVQPVPGEPRVIGAHAAIVPRARGTRSAVFAVSVPAGQRGRPPG